MKIINDLSIIISSSSSLSFSLPLHPFLSVGLSLFLCLSPYYTHRPTSIRQFVHSPPTLIPIIGITSMVAVICNRHNYRNLYQSHSHDSWVIVTGEEIALSLWGSGGPPSTGQCAFAVAQVGWSTVALYGSACNVTRRFACEINSTKGFQIARKSTNFWVSVKFLSEVWMIDSWLIRRSCCITVRCTKKDD